MTEPRKRRVRILCLHGSTQSAASFRAALKPVCDQMGKNLEFHFLEAPYIIAEPGEEVDTQTNQWSRSAILLSQISAIESDHLYRNNNGQIQGQSSDVIEDQLHQIRQQLESTIEGREVREKSQYEDIEGLVSRKTGKSLSRNWVTELNDRRKSVVGVQLALAQIGDYMRENGTFQGVIGYETGGRLAILVQTLLSHPLSSAKQFPSFFPQLPKGVNRMQRMGGWEEEPPPPDDPRLGSENLTKGYVPTQKPFELIISLNPAGALPASLGRHADEWTIIKPPILHTTSPEAFPVHTISISENKETILAYNTERSFTCKQGEDVLSSTWSNLLASWIKLAIESCQGEDKKAKPKILQLNVVDTSASAKL